MKHRRILTISISLAINVLFSLTILPYAIPPFGSYTLRDILEVLLWQGIAAVGWPFGILGSLLSLISDPEAVRVGDFLLILQYPAMLAVIVRLLISRVVQRWERVLLRLLVISSFAALWYSVLNGYDFMMG
jgi:hypothetical protein